ncbi:MAG: prephenate dehydrogenase [Clostridia bacterium]|nr:prephenate dehydrogenase [Clostridia bacterium]MDH7572334.1 prephenate dehydrogenase [Clostridia bacterium]
MQEPRRVCLVGLGLIGGSIGMALVQRHRGPEVVGVDVDPEVVARARQQEAVHRATTEVAEGVAGAELVILAIPPGRMGRVARDLAPYLVPGAVVTDVASTKQRVCREVEESLPPGVAYLGGHPMAGSERAGIGAADPYLFENAVWALTPTARTTPRAEERVTWLVRTLGAHPLTLSPGEHDLCVALASHLPYLAAVALVESLNGNEAAVKLAGRGFRDTTRVAASDPGLWREILAGNREKVLLVLERFRCCLEELAAVLAEGREAALEERLCRAREGRRRLPSGLRPYLPGLEEVVVTIPDRPGSLALVTGMLGQAGINIADIEIMGVREGEAGSIRLGFVRESEALQALEILRSAGVRCRRR